MSYFGAQLRICRKSIKPSLKQKELAKIIHIDPSIVSKWENESEEVRSSVTYIEEVDLSTLISFMRKRQVPEEYLGELGKLWRKETEFSEKEFKSDDPLIKKALATLKNAQPDDIMAIRDDFALMLYKWNEFQRISTEFNEGKLTFGQTENRYTELLREISSREGQRFLARLLLNRGTQRGYQGKMSSAKRDFTNGLSRLSQLGGVDPLIHAELLIELGDYYRKQNAINWENARENYKQARIILESFQGEVARASIERRIASVSLFAGNPKAAIEDCNNSLKISRKVGDLHAERKALEHVAWANSLLGNLDEAIELQIEAHDLGIKINEHPKELAKSFRYLGDYQHLSGDLIEAKNSYESAEEEIKKTRAKMNMTIEEKEKVLRGWLLLGLGSVHSQIAENRFKAQQILHESLEISDDLGDTVVKGLCYWRIGEMFMLDGFYEKALNSFELARGEFNMAGLTETEESKYANPYHLSNLELSLAETHIYLDDYEVAEKHANRAYELAEDFELLVQITTASCVKAKIKFFRGIGIAEISNHYRYAVEKSILSGKLLLSKVLSNISSQLIDLKKNNLEKTISLIGTMVQEMDSVLADQTKNHEQRQILQNWKKDIQIKETQWKTLL